MMQKFTKDEKQKIKKKLKEQEFNREALSKNRFLFEPLFLHGLGSIIIQINVFPSFANGTSYDIRLKDGEYSLFQSEIVEGSLYKVLPGYKKGNCESELLVDFVEQIKDIRVSIYLPKPEYLGVDGTSYQLIYMGGLQNECKFHWWEGGPEEWREVTKLTKYIIDKFENLTFIDLDV